MAFNPDLSDTDEGQNDTKLPHHIDYIDNIICPKKKPSIFNVDNFSVDLDTTVSNPLPPKFPWHRQILVRMRQKAPIVKQVLLYFGFVWFIVIGGLMMLLIEQAIGAPEETLLNRNHCLSVADYSTALFYANSLSTTVGYGNMYACTTIGQLISVLYAMIGIPFVLIILNGLGKMFFNLLSRFYASAKGTVRSRSSAIRHSLGVHDDEKEETEDHVVEIPIWIGIVITMLWLLICAGIFSAFEDWPLGLAFYFCFLTMSTNNLGEVSPKRINWVLANFAIFFGLCLISMTISIVQWNIENLLHHVEAEIDKKFKERMSKGPEKEEDEKSPEEIIEEILTKYGAPWLRALISHEKMETLVQNAEQKASMQSVEIQVDIRDPEKGSGPEYPKIIRFQPQLSQVTIIHLNLQPVQKIQVSTGTNTKPEMLQKGQICKLGPEMIDVGTDCPLITVDNECQAAPEMCTKRLQTPRQKLPWRF